MLKASQCPQDASRNDPLSMLRSYWVLFRAIPTVLRTAVDLWVAIGTIILFLVAVLDRGVGERIMNSWHGLSPWWSLIPVAAFFLYPLARSNYEHFCEREASFNEALATLRQENQGLAAYLTEKKADLSQEAVDLLLAAAEDSAGVSNIRKFRSVIRHLLWLDAFSCLRLIQQSVLRTQRRSPNSQMANG